MSEETFSPAICRSKMCSNQGKPESMRLWSLYNHRHNQYVAIAAGVFKSIHMNFPHGVSPLTMWRDGLELLLVCLRCVFGLEL